MFECTNCIIITGKTTGELLKEIISMIDSNIDLAEECEKSNAANDNFEEALRSQTEKICLKMLKEEIESRYFLGEIKK